MPRLLRKQLLCLGRQLACRLLFDLLLRDK